MFNKKTHNSCFDDKVSASREKHKISLFIFDSERSLTSLFEAKIFFYLQTFNRNSTKRRFYPTNINLQRKTWNNTPSY